MWDCWNGAAASHFFCFSTAFCFLFPLGSRAIRYYIINNTLTTVAVPTSNSPESEESIPTHYLLYVACTPRVACTVRLVLMCTCLLRASISKSNLFCCCLFSSHLRDLHCLVSYISLLFTTGLAAEYVVPYSVYRKNISPARQALCVTSHMYYS